MAEGLEPGAAVIPPHAALTHAAEGHGAGGEMNDGVVDAAAAKMAVIHTMPTDEDVPLRSGSPNPQNLPRQLGFRKLPR